MAVFSSYSTIARHPQQEIASTYPQQAIALFDLFQREDPLDREEGVKGDR
ncbi:MAG: hypothetical protein WCD53_07450 [Microcoleus sp.]